MELSHFSNSTSIYLKVSDTMEPYNGNVFVVGQRAVDNLNLEYSVVNCEKSLS